MDTPCRAGQGFADAHGLARLQQGGTGALGVQGRVPLHPQVFGAPERGVGHVGEPLLGQPPGDAWPRATW